MSGQRPRATLVRLAKKLAYDPCAILAAAEARLLDREVRRVLWSSFPGIEAHLTHSEDSARWQALGARCQHARGARGIRDVSVALGIPQYRLQAIEGGCLKEVRVDLARRYFRFLGIDERVATWCRWRRASVSWMAAAHGRALDGSRRVDETNRETCRLGRGHAGLS
jgi:hypothetical protein